MIVRTSSGDPYTRIKSIQSRSSWVGEKVERMSMMNNSICCLTSEVPPYPAVSLLPVQNRMSPLNRSTREQRKCWTGAHAALVA